VESYLTIKTVPLTYEADQHLGSSLGHAKKHCSCLARPTITSEQCCPECLKWHISATAPAGLL